MRSATTSIVRSATPSRVRPSATFEAIRNDGKILRNDLDPLMSIDHFRMVAPTFETHPHAGFSAITYVLPESAGSMRNMDSRGDGSLITPGSIHWTAAGSGILHNEVPDIPGQMVEGFQIFVKQPAAQEKAQPVIHHVDEADVPRLKLEHGGLVRTIAGAAPGFSAPFDPPSPLVMLDVLLCPDDKYLWKSPWLTEQSGLYLFDGDATIDGQSFSSPVTVILAPGRTITIAAEKGSARFFLFGGEPLNIPVYSNGPFAMSSPAAIEEAVHRYRSGNMGRL